MNNISWNIFTTFNICFLLLGGCVGFIANMLAIAGRNKTHASIAAVIQSLEVFFLFYHSFSGCCLFNVLVDHRFYIKSVSYCNQWLLYNYNVNFRLLEVNLNGTTFSVSIQQVSFKNLTKISLYRCIVKFYF